MAEIALLQPLQPGRTTWTDEESQKNFAAIQRVASGGLKSRLLVHPLAESAGGDETAFRKLFRRDLHGGPVCNLRKVGLLSDRIAPNLQSLGVNLAAAA